MCGTLLVTTNGVFQRRGFVMVTMIVTTIRMSCKIAQSPLVQPTSFSARLDDASPSLSVAIPTMTAEIHRMKWGA